jgi:UDP-glucose 4-epimerase
MARILVTGGAGYVGFPHCRQLAQRGHEVIVLDDGTSGRSRLDDVRQHALVHEVDITNAPACARTVQNVQPDVVIHLAALHFIPECNRRPVDAVRINVIGTDALLKGCAAVPGLARVVVTSSAAVYPVTDVFSRESDPPGPTDIYGITKATNEWQARRFTEETGVTTVAVRLFNVFGPGETNPHLLPEIIAQLKAGRHRLALGNPTPKRSYVFIDDVVDAFEAMAMAPLPDGFHIMNLGHREEASVIDLLRMISSSLGAELSAEQDPARVRPSDRPFLRCDPDLTAQLTGWIAKFSIEAGVREFLRREGLA